MNDQIDLLSPPSLSFTSDFSGDLLDTDFAALVGGVLTECYWRVFCKVVQKVGIIKHEMLCSSGS